MIVQVVLNGYSLRLNFSKASRGGHSGNSPRYTDNATPILTQAVRHAIARDIATVPAHDNPPAQINVERTISARAT